MPRLTIDNMPIDVPAGSSVLDAARKLDIDIPSLCYHERYHPATACMLCLVRVLPSDRLIPSCATPAEEGMQVQSETAAIRAVRRAGLELLLSDHAGDCIAPCQTACPTHVDLPAMLRQVATGQLHDAIVTIRRDLALPAVLGRVCDDYCENACRRAHVDSPAAICLVKRFVADADLAKDQPYIPPRAARTGKSVAIVGAGPAGLSAAYHLLIAGHACTIFDQRPAAGGMLRYEIDEDRLPRDVLDAEIAIVNQLGAIWRLGTCVGRDVSVATLQKQFDAVLLAVGPIGAQTNDVLGALAAKGRILVDAATHETATPSVFAAGHAVRPRRVVVRAVADGKAAAASIHAYLTAGKAVWHRRPAGACTGETPVPQKHRPFAVRMGRLDEQELAEMAASASQADRVVPSQGPRAGLTAEEARAEAERCLRCDCSVRDGCRLRHYAEAYGATATRYRGRRRAFTRHVQPGHVVYEPGKCILCGLCVQAAEAAGEELGLTFIGRGFDVRVGVPFDRPLSEALRRAAQECIDVCPSGALVPADLFGCHACGNHEACGGRWHPPH